MFAKVSYIIRTHAISSPQSQILRGKGTICLRNIGTRSNKKKFGNITPKTILRQNVWAEKSQSVI